MKIKSLLAAMVLAIMPAIAAAQSIPAIVAPPPSSGSSVPDGGFDMTTCAGVVWGTGRTSAVRTSNATNANSCIASATTAKKAIYLPSRHLEVQGAALYFPPGVVGVIGVPSPDSTSGTVITQWSTNLPTVQFGVAGTGGAGLASEVSNLRVGTGVDGVSGSACFRFGYVLYANISNLKCDPYASLSGTGGKHLVYNGVDFIAGTTEFSNVWNNIQISAASNSAWFQTNNGTGSTHLNTYLGGGSASDRTTMTGNVLHIASRGGDTWFNTNVEWVTNSRIFIDNVAEPIVFNGFHTEGMKWTGTFAPSMFGLSFASVAFSGLNLLDTDMLAADGNTGTAQIFSTFGQNRLSVTNMDMWGNSSGTYGVIGLPWSLYVPDGGSAAFRSTIQISNFVHRGNTGLFSPDNTLPASSMGSPEGFSLYTYGKNRSVVDGAFFKLADANVTNYGAYTNAFYYQDAAMTANRTLTFSPYMAPSGSGVNIRRNPNDALSIYRSGNATGSFTFSILRGLDGAAIGNPLSAANTSYSLDQQLVQDLNNSDVAALSDADQTLYWQGAGYRTISPTVARTITLSANVSATLGTPAPRGSCMTIAVAAGAAGSVTVGAVTLSANTSGRFCTNTATGAAVRVQ